MKIYFTVFNLLFQAGESLTQVHPILFHTQNENILFDAGYPGQISEIQRELQKIHLEIEDLTQVILSHHDHDHIGSLAALKKRNPKIKVLAHVLEKPYIQGEEPSLRLTQALEYNAKLSGASQEAGARFVSYLQSIEACEVDQSLSDTYEILPGLQVCHTPGHTPGHLSLWLENKKILFTGDALVSEKGIPEIANPQFALNIKECFESVKKIQDLNPHSLICYHGGEVVQEIQTHLAQILQNR